MEKVRALAVTIAVAAAATIAAAPSGAAVVTNPGPIRLALTAGQPGTSFIRIRTPDSGGDVTVDLAGLAAPATLTGTIDAAGNITIPVQGVALPPVTATSSSGTATVQIVATAPWTGQLAPATGAMTIAAPFRAEVVLPGIPGSCSAGSAQAPILASFTTGASPAVPGAPAPPPLTEGAPYRQGDGTVVMIENRLAIPAVTGCPALAASVDDALDLPSAPGDVDIRFAFAAQSGGGFNRPASAAAGDPRSRAPTYAQLARLYAPRFEFDSNEDYWPMSVEEFIAHSALWWMVKDPDKATDGYDWDENKCGNRDDAVDRRLAKNGNVEPAKLGGSTRAGAYRVHVYSLKTCSELEGDGAYVRADSFTRPFDSTTASRATYTTESGRHTLSARQGFYLNLDDHFRTGHKPGLSRTLASVPMYYTVVTAGGHDYIRYFVMYGCSSVRIARRERKCWHEGEWEGITIRLSSSSLGGVRYPDEAIYLAHHWSFRVPWYNAIRVAGSGDRRRTHPVVYVGDGSHAGYPDNGAWPTLKGQGDDADGKGPTWDSWTGGLADVRHAAWAGFGGSWGSGVGAEWGDKDVDDTDRTGPAGPPYNLHPAIPGENRGGNCSSYYTTCVRAGKPDLDCKDIPIRGFHVLLANVGLGFRRLDPHNLDGGDKDHEACERSLAKQPYDPWAIPR